MKNNNSAASGCLKILVDLGGILAL